MRQYVRTSGFKELERALLELGTKEASKIGRRAVRTTAQPVLRAARANAPVGDGRLRRSISLRVDRLRRSLGGGVAFSALVYVSPRLGPRPRKSDRRSTVRGVLQDARYNYQIGSWANVYGAFQEFGVGAPAQPFLTPAWDSQGGPVALRRMAHEVDEGLQRFAASVKKG